MKLHWKKEKSNINNVYELDPLIDIVRGMDKYLAKDVVHKEQTLMEILNMR